jgi:hypothetical protein
MNGSVNLNLVAIANLPCTGNIMSTRHVTFDVCTGVGGEPTTEPAFVLQPNPATDMVTFIASGKSEGASTLIITGTNGTTMLEMPIELNGNRLSKQIDLSRFARGLYIVQLKTSTRVLTQKLNVL